MTRRRSDGERGIVIPMTAMVITVLVLMVSLAIDIGYASSEIRKLQKIADIASTDATRYLDGRVEGIPSDPTSLYNDVQAQVLASTARNGFTPGGSKLVAFELGKMIDSFDVDLASSLPPGTTPYFEPYFQPTTAADAPDAVQVTITDTVDWFFQTGSRTYSKVAVAQRIPKSWVEIGSVAAGLQPQPIDTFDGSVFIQAFNRQLAAKFNGTADPGIDVLSYEGLADADIELDRFAANAGFGSPDEMFESEMTAGQFFSAAATTLDQQAADGDPQAAAAAATLRQFETGAGVDSSSTMQLGDSFHLDDECASKSDPSSDTPCAADTSISVLSLLTGGASAIDGSNLVAYGLTSTVPGVSIVSIDHSTIEAAQSAYLQRNSGSVSTSQVRFQIVLQIAPSLVPGLTAPMQVPIVLEAAQASGTLTRTDCFEPPTLSEADVFVESGLVKANIGVAQSLSTATTTVNSSTIIQAGGINLSVALGIVLGGLNLTPITASSSKTIAGGSGTLTFLPNDPPVAEQRFTGAVGTLIAPDLLSSMVTNVPGPLDNYLRNRLTATFSLLDARLFKPLLQASGITVGGADVRPHDMDCEVPSLVD